MERRCFAFLSAFSTAMLILSNLVFLGGGHVGRIFWKRVFIQGKLPPVTHIRKGTVWPFLFFVSYFAAIYQLDFYICVQFGRFSKL